MPQEQEQLEESKELEAESILQRPPAMNYETSSRPFAKKDQPS